MNWQNPSEQDRVVLGVIRLKATTGNNKLPPVFINPGVSAALSNNVTRSADSFRGLADLELPL